MSGMMKRIFDPVDQTLSSQQMSRLLSDVSSGRCGHLQIWKHKEGWVRGSTTYELIKQLAAPSARVTRLEIDTNLIESSRVSDYAPYMTKLLQLRLPRINGFYSTPLWSDWFPFWTQLRQLSLVVVVDPTGHCNFTRMEQITTLTRLESLTLSAPPTTHVRLGEQFPLHICAKLRLDRFNLVGLGMPQILARDCARLSASLFVIAGIFPCQVCFSSITSDVCVEHRRIGLDARYYLARNQFLNSEVNVYHRLFPLLLALAPLDLPPYVTLEIVDWLPVLSIAPDKHHAAKIGWIEGVKRSYRRLRRLVEEKRRSLPACSE
jgi:hypothetical protein